MMRPGHGGGSGYLAAAMMLANMADPDREAAVDSMARSILGDGYSDTGAGLDIDFNNGDALRKKLKERSAARKRGR